MDVERDIERDREPPGTLNNTSEEVVMGSDLLNGILSRPLLSTTATATSSARGLEIGCLKESSPHVPIYRYVYDLNK